MRSKSGGKSPSRPRRVGKSQPRPNESESANETMNLVALGSAAPRYLRVAAGVIKDAAPTVDGRRGQSLSFHGTTVSILVGCERIDADSGLAPNEKLRDKRVQLAYEKYGPEARKIRKEERDYLIGLYHETFYDLSASASYQKNAKSMESELLAHDLRAPLSSLRDAFVRLIVQHCDGEIPSDTIYKIITSRYRSDPARAKDVGERVNALAGPGGTESV